MKALWTIIRGNEAHGVFFSRAEARRAAKRLGGHVVKIQRVKE